MARYPTISRAITLKQARTVEAAFDHATRLRCKPNHHLTIRWGSTEFSDRPFTALQDMLERMRKWLRRRGVPEIWIWVRERASTSPEHVHIALFCPLEFVKELSEAIERWIKPTDPRAALIKPCPNKPNCNPRLLVCGYFLKGGTKAVRDSFPVPSERRASPCQGIIRGKRVGVSRPIGSQAIKAYFGAQTGLEPPLAGDEVNPRPYWSPQ